ncbi:MAG: hypothetical protein K0S58_2026 [Nitrospira sp.]|jgi:hypothetical protein|nr:hypothetical protein [Nitrospira sp.]
MQLPPRIEYSVNAWLCLMVGRTYGEIAATRVGKR